MELPFGQSPLSLNDSFLTRSDKNNLHFGAMVCCVGVRYKSYCSNIVRTYMVNPTETMKENYELLLKIFDELCATLKHGQSPSQILTEVLIRVSTFPSK